MERNLIPIVVPNLGEGIREAIVVALLHDPGDAVSENEPLLQVETVKSVSDVLAPCDGSLAEWSVAVGDLVPIGSCVGRLHATLAAASCDDGDQAVDPQARQFRADAKPAIRNRQMSPRTRRLLEEHGLLDKADTIPRHGETLLPEDVEAYVHSRETLGTAVNGVRSLTPDEVVAIRRLEANGSISHPTMTIRVDWANVEAALEALRVPAERRQRAVSELVAWATARAMVEHPRFRTQLVAGGKCATTPVPIVGIAMAASGALPSIANVRMEKDVSWIDFQAAAEQAIDEASHDYRTADPHATVIVTNMMPFQVHLGMPSLIAPAVAVIAIGDTYLAPVQRQDDVAFSTLFNLSMAFDHRLIGGIHAAHLLQAIKGALERLPNDILDRHTPTGDRLLSEVEICDTICRRFALEVGVNPDLIPLDVSIAKMGLDSIMVVELAVVADKLAKFLEDRFSVKAGDFKPLAEMSLQEIARLVARQVV